MAFSLNQIDKIFQDFAASHKQINSYGLGEASEIGSDKLLLNYSAGVMAGRESAPVYPLLWAVPMPSDISRRFVIWKFSIIVCDLVLPDESNLTEVLSDTQQILQDFLANLQAPAYNSSFTIEGEYEYVITPFREERFNDCTAGWISDIELKISNLNDRCAIPMTGAPTL